MSIELVMPSNWVICCPLLLLLPVFASIRVFSNESALHIRWPKYWSFSFSLAYHSLLQLTTFFQNYPTWPVRLGWPCMIWLIVSLSYTRLWSMWSFWLVFCDGDNIFYAYRIKSGASIPSLCYVFFRAFLLDRFPWKWTLRKKVDCRSFSGEAVGKYTY